MGLFKDAKIRQRLRYFEYIFVWRWFGKLFQYKIVRHETCILYRRLLDPHKTWSYESAKIETPLDADGIHKTNENTVKPV